jgi:hypothetical protein
MTSSGDGAGMMVPLAAGRSCGTPSRCGRAWATGVQLAALCGYLAGVLSSQSMNAWWPECRPAHCRKAVGWPARVETRSRRRHARWSCAAMVPGTILPTRPMSGGPSNSCGSIAMSRRFTPIRGRARRPLPAASTSICRTGGAFPCRSAPSTTRAWARRVAAVRSASASASMSGRPTTSSPATGCRVRISSSSASRAAPTPPGRSPAC